MKKGVDPAKLYCYMTYPESPEHRLEKLTIHSYILIFVIVTSKCISNGVKKATFGPTDL